jgi:hypothetical protein
MLVSSRQKVSDVLAEGKAIKILFFVFLEEKVVSFKNTCYLNFQLPLLISYHEA